ESASAWGLRGHARFSRWFRNGRTGPVGKSLGVQVPERRRIRKVIGGPALAAVKRFHARLRASAGAGAGPAPGAGTKDTQGGGRRVAARRGPGVAERYFGAGGFGAGAGDAVAFGATALMSPSSSSPAGVTIAWNTLSEIPSLMVRTEPSSISTTVPRLPLGMVVMNGLALSLSRTPLTVAP